MADEVVLIDLTPEALIARLRAGKVYPAERVPAALNNFFKIENLAALRETALRQVAEDVEVKRLVPASPTRSSPMRRDEEGLPAARPRQDRRRSPSGCWRWRRSQPHSERVVRRAWRSAQRLDAELDVLVVRPPGREPSAEDRERLEALRRLVVDAGRAPARGGGRGRRRRRDLRRALAREHVRADGRPSPRRGLRRLNEPLLTRLLRGLPGVDVRIVADPTLRGQTGEGEQAQALAAETPCRSLQRGRHGNKGAVNGAGPGLGAA